MAKIISVHSFRRGTGKSNVIANVAALLATEGQHIGVIDTNIQSPSTHILFSLDEAEINFSLTDYLWGKCDIEQIVYDITPSLSPAIEGQLFLIPASIKTSNITRALRQGYDMGLLNYGVLQLIEMLKLDVLLVDTHAGLNEETLALIAISDTLAIILRPDKQDYPGTEIIAELARQLKVPRMVLIVNEVASSFDFATLKSELMQAYNCEVVAMLPHTDDLAALASADIFIRRYPHHTLTATLQQLAVKLVT